jgi:hypothetical protein
MYTSDRLTNSRAWQASLLIRRDAILRTSGAPANGISQIQLASACLREAPPCGAKAGPFLSNLGEMTFLAAYKLYRRLITDER